jgi:hypothetical protein
MGMLLIVVLLNYGTLAKVIMAKLASKNIMPGFMKPTVDISSPSTSQILIFG